MSRRHALVRSGLTLVGLRDWAVPVALAALGAAESWDNAVPDSGAQSVQTPAALLVALPLIWRRRAPVLALAAVLAGFVPVWFTEHRTGGPSFAAVVSLLLALYSVGAHADRRIGRPAALAALAGLVGLLAADVASGNLRAVDAVGTFLFFPAAWLGGDIVVGRHLRVLALEQHAADLERDQDQRARAAVAEERARIAREMHDVLAHTTSMIVLQGGAARQVLRSAPDTAEQLLLSIEETGRDALGELRRLLGLLRDDDEPTMLAP